MKKGVLYLVAVLISGGLLFACGGGGGGGSESGGDSTPPVSTLNAGTWSGDMLKFNVSSDGAKISATDSALTTSSGAKQSLVLGPMQYKGSCSGSTYTASVTMSFANDIPIANSKFSYSAGWDLPIQTVRSAAKIDGTFTSASAANGSWSFKIYDDSCNFDPTKPSSGNGTVYSGSGSWTASSGQTSAKSLSTEQKEAVSPAPVRTENIHDDTTGEIVGTMQIEYVWDK